VALFLETMRLAAVALVLASTPALAQTRIEVQARVIEHFDNRDRDIRRFGKLEFRGGLELKSAANDFGGISSLRMEPDGSRFLALTDRGRWLRGRITYSGTAPSGVAGLEIAPMLASDGKTLSAHGMGDTESLAGDGGTVYAGVERKHGILKYDFARNGVRARGTLVPAPDEFKTFPFNEGIEALAVMPKGSAYPGALLAITEAALDAAGNIKAFVLGESNPVAFSVKRMDDFSVTDCAFLPSGDLLILERRYSVLRGAAVRIRRIAASQIRPGAVVTGEQLLFGDVNHQVDNYEALGVHRTAAGETVLTIVSDDNFNPLQRTLLMQFTLLE
jgi:hypothetical protein